MRSLTVSILFCFSLLAIGQVNDFGFWPGLKISKELTHKLSLNFWTQMRSTENATRPMNYFNDLCLSYDLTKKISIEGAYVNVEHLQLDDRLSIQHQFYVDASWKSKIAKRLYFKYMPMLQVMFTDYYSSEKGKVPEYYIRNKFRLEYNLSKRIDPFCFVEPRHFLNKETPGYLNRMRYSLGFNYRINNHNSVDVYYMIQQEKNLANPTTLYIFGINYNLSLH